MKIGIHHRKGSYSEHWLKYCQGNNINFKVVNAYSTNIINDLHDCDIFMWHFHHNNPKDILFAKQLLYSLKQSGKKVFPDFNTMWHFDDKVGQKYLLESIGAPLVPTYVYYDKKEAIEWVKKADFPKVFKLRGGAGSANVRLVKSKSEVNKLIKKAFGNGFKNYDALSNLRERWRKYRLKKANLWDVVKGVIRLAYEPEFSKIMGREKGYVYFQDLIPACEFDIRVKIIDNKCWAFKRRVRKDDFRASGSDDLIFSRDMIPLDTIRTAFKIYHKLKLQTVAFDFLINHNNQPVLIELSYAFGYDEGENFGYWDENLNWYEGKFNPYGWMVDLMLK